MSADINYLVRERIRNTLDMKHDTIPWLAEQTGISVGVLRSRMAGKTNFTIDELGVIAYVLGERPSDMLPEQVMA